ncbi:MAG: hypothetical protein WCJ94_00065 [bacterium]
MFLKQMKNKVITKYSASIMFIIVVVFLSACLKAETQVLSKVTPNATIIAIPAAVSGTSALGVTDAVINIPDFLKAEAKGIEVHLSWNASLKKDIVYNIYRSVSPDTNFIKINKDFVKQNNYIDNSQLSLTAPKSGKLYYYKVTAIDSGLESKSSTTVMATAFAPLAPPDKITLVAGFSSVKIKWVEPEASGSYGVSGYNIFRSTVAGILTQINPVTITAIQYDDSGLTNGARYDYSLQSIDAQGNTSALSALFSVTPFSSIASPKNLTTTAVSSESIKLIWDLPDGSGTYGISGYNIYRSTQAGIFSMDPINGKLAKEYKTDDNRVFYFDNMINSSSRPQAGSIYYYKVVPVDLSGNSGNASDIITGAVPVFEVNRNGIISADISEYGLPPESRLSLSGSKSLTIKYAHTWWKKNSTASSADFNIDQKLKLALKGNIGTKINVDVNYDENTLTDEYTKISISYAGEKDETLQEVTFGDLTLDLPSTRYLSYAPQKLFGLRGKVKIGDKLSITALAAQTKGINDTQVFTGSVRKKQTNSRDGIDISDMSYILNTYYYITKDSTVKIKPGTLKLYCYDGGLTAADVNTVYSTPTSAYHFRLLYSGVDYLVDYNEKIIKFNVGIANNFVIVAGYELEDGTKIGLKADDSLDLNEAYLVSAADGMTTASAHLIQDGTQTSARQSDISHKVLSYYYMGETKINNPVTDTGGFKIVITNPDNTKNYYIPQPWETNASDYYTIDTDFGILKFKSFFPFAAGQAQPCYPPYNLSTGNEDDAYKSVSAKSLYKIHLEYNYQVSSYKLDNSPVVFGSERVMVGGVLQKKNIQYEINYDAGEITFYKDKVAITDSTEIKVTYEYLPFIGANNSNLFGGRLDYDLLDNLKLAITGLYKTSNAGTTTPDARSTEISLNTPYNSLVVDGNVTFDLSKDNFNAILNALPIIDNSNIPVDFKFAAETAYSNLNPNTYEKSFSGGRVEKGPAMIDDMESADIITSATMLKTAWFPAVMPPFKTAQNRAYIERGESIETTNLPTSTDPLATNQTKVLKLDFSGLTSDKWDSFRQVLSTSGISLNQYNTLEISVKVSTDQPVRMSVDVGVISEDSNGNGTFAYNGKDGTRNDSEDADQNKTFITVNDIGTGQGIYTGGSPAYWGAGNNVLDTEDMNGNGILDTQEEYYHFDSEVSPTGANVLHSKLLLSNGDNWVDIKIPLKDWTNIIGGAAVNNIGTNKDKYMSFIKHLRINFKGSGAAPASGTIKIASIKFTGNSWSLQTPANETDLAGNPVVVDSSKMNIESINQNTDSQYTPNLDYYDWTTDNDKKFETALKISYKISNLDQSSIDNKTLYYVTKSLNASSGYDFHSYKYLKMDVYYKAKDAIAGNGRVMFIRVGSGSDSDPLARYYQYNELLDPITTGGWRTVVFALDGSDGKRSSTVSQPNLRQAQYISLGFINPNTTQPSEIMYVNNIRLTDAQSSTGRASFVNSAMNYAGIGSLSHTYEDKEATFYTLADAGRADIKQHEISTNVSFNYTQIPFLPISTNYFKSSKVLDGPNANDPGYTNNNLVYDIYSEGFNNIVSFNLIPDLNFTNNTTVRKNIVNYPGYNAYLDSVVSGMTINPSLSWKAPTKLFFIPLGSNSFVGNLSINNSETVYNSIALSPTAQGIYYYNWRNDRKQDYQWNGVYNIFGLDIQPSYQYGLTEQMGYLTSKYVYYQNSITDPHNRVNKYYVLRRNISPKLNISYPGIWIFSPALSYLQEYKMDYTQSYLDNHGRMEASTSVNLSTFASWLPDIGRYAFSVDSTQHYDEIQNPGSFGKYDKMPFESQWNIFLWKMLNNEKEILRFETAAKNGAFVITHSLNFNVIKVLSIFDFTPSVSYSLNRTFYSQGAVRQFSEGFNISVNSITINNVTIPLPILSDLVSNQQLTGTYSYMRNLTKDSNRKITLDDMTNNFSAQLPYVSKSGINGVLSISGSRNQQIRQYLRSWTGSIMPALTFNYKYRQTDPITFPSWLWLIGDKTFRLEQALDLGVNLSVKYSLSGDNDLNINRADVKEYTLGTSASYNILQNLTTTFKLEYSHKEDKWKKDQEYDRFSVSVGAVIEF